MKLLYKSKAINHFKITLGIYNRVIGQVIMDTNKGLMLETSAFQLIMVANLHYQTSWWYFEHHPVVLSHCCSTTVSLETDRLYNRHYFASSDYTQDKESFI